jgi:hypothetical protein
MASSKDLEREEGELLSGTRLADVRELRREIEREELEALAVSRRPKSRLGRLAKRGLN